MRARVTDVHEGTTHAIDYAKRHLGVRRDWQLAEALGIEPARVAKQKRVPLTSDFLLRLHDITGIPVNELRAAAGLPTVAPYQKE